MKMNHEDKYIKDVLESIQTPGYDPTNDVMRRINATPRKNLALKRIIIIGAILCLIGVALGAAELSGWQSFNLFGEKTGSGSPILPAITVPPGYESEGYTPIKRATPEPEDPEEVEYYMNFMEQTKPDEVRIGFTLREHSSGGGSDSGLKTQDSSMIDDIMSNSISPIKEPAYIPEGYAFKSAKMDFYADESVPPELVYSETKNDRSFLIYQLKEGYEQKVSNIELVYENEKGGEFTYNASLSQATPDNMEYRAQEGAEVQAIDVTGFDEGIWIHNEKNEFSPNQLFLYKEIPMIEAIDLFNKSLRELRGADEEWEEDFMNERIEYISIVCHVYSNSLDVEELVKIAESIN